MCVSICNSRDTSTNMFYRMNIEYFSMEYIKWKVHMHRCIRSWWAEHTYYGDFRLEWLVIMYVLAMFRIEDMHKKVPQSTTIREYELLNKA